MRSIRSFEIIYHSELNRLQMVSIDQSPTSSAVSVNRRFERVFGRCRAVDAYLRLRHLRYGEALPKQSVIKKIRSAPRCGVTSHNDVGGMV
jgi:hypothetical protein